MTPCKMREIGVEGEDFIDADVEGDLRVQANSLLDANNKLNVQAVPK